MLNLDVKINLLTLELFNSIHSVCTDRVFVNCKGEYNYIYYDTY